MSFLSALSIFFGQGRGGGGLHGMNQYDGAQNSTQLLNINTTKFQVEREPVYLLDIYHVGFPVAYMILAYILLSIQLL